MSVTVALVPGVWWEDTDGDPPPVMIAGFVREALACERRLPKGVDTRAEARRYASWCNAIREAVAVACRDIEPSQPDTMPDIVASGGLAKAIIRNSFIDVIPPRREGSGPGRLGASFCPPAAMAEHVAAWRALSQRSDAVWGMLRLSELALAHGAGIVSFANGGETNAPTAERDWSALLPAKVPRDRKPAFRQFASPTGLGADLTFSVDERRLEGVARLRQRIARALGQGIGITFGSEEPHDVITEVLHEFVVVDGGIEGRYELPIAYADGSAARPFPLFALAPPVDAVASDESGAADLTIGLMSMRHPELDGDVDAYWFRNRSVSKSRPLGETDDYCYDATRRQLPDLVASGVRVVHLVHTGFEPAVVGFYRAVVDYALAHERPSDIRIVPRYLNRHGSDGMLSGAAWALSRGDE